MELGLACAAALGGTVSATRVRSTVPVAPIADGEPVTTSVSYDPQLLLLTLLLAAVAGVLAVVGAARLGRARRGRKDSAVVAAAAVTGATLSKYPRGGMPGA